MASNPIPILTEEEYLKRERAAEFKSEYLGGVVHAMAGGTENHALVGGNLFGEVWLALRGRDCKVFFENMRVRISRISSYYYPDIMVACAKTEFATAAKDNLLNPVVIIEVLSPSTEAFDRGEKCRNYKRIETLREYVLVSPDKPIIERLERADNGFWLTEDIEGLDATLRLSSLDIAIPLSAIYRGIDLAPPL